MLFTCWISSRLLQTEHESGGKAEIVLNWLGIRRWLQTREQSATYIISLNPPSEPSSYPIIETTAIGSSEVGIMRGLELIEINILGSNTKECLGKRPKLS
jgi:hypothetical protein